ncbi:MAG: Hsp20/alpha crystallin family protein [Phycisphaerae bacterium]
MTTTSLQKPEESKLAQTEPTWNRLQFRPNVDIVERPGELTVLADMPGTRAEDVDIQFEGGVLTIHAKVPRRQAEDTAYVLKEYGVGDFHRTFQVSEAIDSERIGAEYSDGVLTLHLPKTESARLRKIAVKAK